MAKALNTDKHVYAIVSPSFVRQFGQMASPVQIKEAIRELGFRDVIEVGLGADLTTLNEAHEYVESVPEKIPFMGTSCCYSWKLMVKKKFPEINDKISESSTPMIYSGKHIKKMDEKAQVALIGPCI